MKKLKKFFIFPCLIIFVAIFFQGVSFAAFEDQFTINYSISYNINENGETTVTQDTDITNLQNDTIPTNYSLSLIQLKIYDIQAKSNGKNAEIQSKENPNGTDISVKLLNNSIGKGRKNTISIFYKTKNIAVKTGNVWNLYIPKIQTPETTSNYNVSVVVPDSFGPEIYFSPTPIIKKKQDGKTVYYLTKESFQNTGISAAFGSYQTINFRLKYQLENTTITFSRFDITLPPDINKSQEISYSQIEPKPLSKWIDADGNLMARYLLPPKNKIEVTVSGSARIFNKQINSDIGSSFDAIPKNLLTYTKYQKYWETNSKSIQDTAKKLKDPTLSVTKNTQKIYKYVTQNLNYNFDAVKQEFVERKGAETALTEKGTWTCMEFTDLFIALCRAMGIPAREINGYAFGGNENSQPVAINLKGGDLLHSWAEFYDPKYGWIQVDPTWGTTSGIDYFSKLDTNHLAFVIRGLNSEYPYPAGTFRFSDDQKLIDVAFSQDPNPQDFTPKIIATKKFNWNIFELIKGNEKYEFKNDGNVFVYNKDGKEIIPGESKIIYLPADSKTTIFVDAQENEYKIELKY